MPKRCAVRRWTRDSRWRQNRSAEIFFLHWPQANDGWSKVVARQSALARSATVNWGGTDGTASGSRCRIGVLFDNRRWQMMATTKDSPGFPIIPHPKKRFSAEDRSGLGLRIGMLD